MSTATPTTVALTGKLPLLLILAAVFTWPLATILLAFYTRAVRRCMSRRAADLPTAASGQPVSGAMEAPTLRGTTPASVRAENKPGSGSSPTALLAQLLVRPRQAAAVYLIAGIVYAAVIAVAQLTAAAIPLLPVRTLMLTWVFAWPVIPAIAVVGAGGRRETMLVIGSYFAGLVMIGAIGMRNSPELTWGQVFLMWAIYDLAPTVLLWTFLARKIRAVGPLVLAFVFVALVGSDSAVTAVGSSDSYLRSVIAITGQFGLGATGTLLGLIAIGFALFGAVAWAGLAWLGRRYEAKKISDESVAVDAIFLLFMVVYSIDLVFEGPFWSLAGVVAFAAYKACVRAGFTWVRSHTRQPESGPALLVLRSFAIGRASQQLFDVVQRHWRRSGSIQLIAGTDLAKSTVEPHEFLDFVAGRLARRFIDRPETLTRRLAENDVRPDRDLRFRVNDYLCFDNTWKATLSALVSRSDAIVMDLRGFSSANTGCVFEIGELAARAPLERVVFIVDEKTDRQLLADSLVSRSSGTGDTGGSRLAAIRTCELRSLSSADVRPLLMALAAAATSPTARPLEQSLHP